MSQRIKRKIKLLCQSLLYMTAVRLCPAMRKKAHSAGANEYCAQPQPSRIEAPADKGIMNTLSAFGRAVISLPFTTHGINTVEGDVILVYAFREQHTDFGTKIDDDKPRVSRPRRKAGRSQRTGFDLLRFTQILARGDLEEQRAAYNTSAAR